MAADQMIAGKAKLSQTSKECGELPEFLLIFTSPNQAHRILGFQTELAKIKSNTLIPEVLWNIRVFNYLVREIHTGKLGDSSKKIPDS